MSDELCFWCRKEPAPQHAGIALPSEYYGRENEVIAYRGGDSFTGRDAIVAVCEGCK